LGVRSLFRRLEEARSPNPEAKRRLGSRKDAGAVYSETDVVVDISIDLKMLGKLLRKQAVEIKVPDVKNADNTYTVTMRYMK